MQNKLTESFIGTPNELREFFLKKWCRSKGIDESKFRSVGIGLLDEIKIKNIKCGSIFKLWAGSSGCNFMMVDSSGGTHNFLDLDENIYEVFE